MRSILLDYLPRGVARRAPELQNVPTELVGEAKNWGDDRVGTPRAAGQRATANHQAPHSQHALSLHGASLLARRPLL